jgi:hypothetical protein
MVFTRAALLVAAAAALDNGLARTPPYVFLHARGPPLLRPTP